MADVRVNEVKPIYLDMGISLTAATSVWIRVVPPNRPLSEATTYVATVGETTKLKHDKLATTFNKVGIWLLSGSADFGNEHIESTEWARLEVGPSL